VGEEVAKDIRFFFASGRMFNNTFVSLVPKTSTVASLNDFRPISHCNVSI